jgi:RimJ/RimL family protein N-acetyltransferase
VSDAIPEVLLRRFETSAQEQALARILSDPEVSRHLLVSFEAQGGLAGNTPRFRRNFAEAWERMGFGGMLIARPGDEAVQGFVALKPHLREGAPQAGRYEIYFALARAAWGRGLASRAVAAFLDALTLALRPVSVHACLDALRNPAARRVLEKQGFVHERDVPLREFAGPALARGSLELALWRLRDPGAGAQILEQSAERIGQLAEAAGLDPSTASRSLCEALEASGLAARLGPGLAREAALRAFAAGAQRACYALFSRTLRTVR